MPRIHLLISPSPMKVGGDTTALCHRTIPNAQPLPVDVAEGKKTVIFCRDCFGATQTWAGIRLSERVRYVCAIVAGEESLHP